MYFGKVWNDFSLKPSEYIRVWLQLFSLVKLVICLECLTNSLSFHNNSLVPETTAGSLGVIVALPMLHKDFYRNKQLIAYFSPNFFFKLPKFWMLIFKAVKFSLLERLEQHNLPSLYFCMQMCKALLLADKWRYEFFLLLKERSRKLKNWILKPQRKIHFSIHKTGQFCSIERKQIKKNRKSNNWEFCMAE